MSPSQMNNSRSVEQILKEIREACLEERRDAARSSETSQTVVVPLRESEPTWSVEETRWDSEKLTVVWPSSPGDRRD